MHWRQKLAAGRMALQMRAPWIMIAVHAMVVREHPGLGSVAVTRDWVLLVDPAFIEKASVKEIATSLFHEVCHLLRNHAARFDRVFIPHGCQRNSFHTLWNIAGDCEINDDLLDWDFPKGYGVFPKDYELPNGQLAEFYFQEILKNEDEDKDPGDGGDGDGDPEPGDQNQGGSSSSEGSQPDNQDQPGDGSGGDPQDQQDGSQDGAGSGSPNQDQGGESSGGGQHGPHKEHRCGSGAGAPVPNEPQSEGRSPIEQKDFRRRTAEAIQQAASNSRGDVPGGLSRWADQELGPPKIQWEDQLNRVSYLAIETKTGDDDAEYSRPHRWQCAFEDDDVLLPHPFSRVPKTTLAIDASGSMGKKELTAAMTESKGVMDSMETPVEILVFDAKVQAVEKVQSITEACAALIGGGGTSFVALFDYFIERHDKPDILIIKTDGIAPAPAKNPLPGTVIIWVLIGRHRRKPWIEGQSRSTKIDYGDFIEVPSEEERKKEAA